MKISTTEKCAGTEPTMVFFSFDTYIWLFTGFYFWNVFSVRHYEHFDLWNECLFSESYFQETNFTKHIFICSLSFVIIKMRVWFLLSLVFIECHQHARCQTWFFTYNYKFNFIKTGENPTRMWLHKQVMFLLKIIQVRVDCWVN